MMSFLDDFLVRAALAGIAVAIAAGPLGCFVVWRRMAYFGDATAHAAMLGVALALAWSVSIVASTLVAALVMAVGISFLQGGRYSTDTLLGVFSHSALAIGLVAVSLVDGIRLDLMSYLFGDLLAVGRTDLAVIWGGALAVLAVIVWRWSKILLATLNPDMARASGINARHEEFVLMIMLAVVVALAIKIVGVLLIAAMLIIPAAAARPITSTPEVMAVVASIFGAVSVLAGLGLSLVADTPAGPSVVCMAAILFAVTGAWSAIRKMNANL